jgi:hypothetical protein
MALLDMGLAVTIFNRQVFEMAKVAKCVGPCITDHGLTLTTVNGSQIALNGVFMVEFCMAGWDVKIPVAMCSYISLPAIISINLMQQEQLIFDVAMDQVIFGFTTGAHKGWKQGQVTINVAIMINALEAHLVACQLCLLDVQMMGPNTAFILSLHNRTWAENMVAAITDKKGIVHLYHATC